MKRSSRINFPSPLHLVTSNDELRPAMSAVWFQNGYAVATDAHILIRQSFKFLSDYIENIELLEGKCIHRNAFARIFREKQIIVEAEGIRSLDKDGNNFFYPYSNGSKPENFMGTDIKFVRYSEIIEQAIADCKASTLNYNGIGINIEILARLNKAFYHETQNNTFRFSFPSAPQKPILIEATSVSREEQCAIIMPVMVTNS